MKVAAGDTMLGRKVAERLAVVAPTDRFRRACTAHGTDVESRGGRLVIEWQEPMSQTSSTTREREAR